MLRFMKRLVVLLWKTLSIASLLCILFTAVALVLVAPIPGLMFHYKWCVDNCKSVFGVSISILSCVAFVMMIFGCFKPNRKLRHCGFFLLLLCVGGVGLWQSDKIQIGLTLAFVFSALLLYFTLLNELVNFKEQPKGGSSKK